jgi:hypothetical protein
VAYHDLPEKLVGARPAFEEALQRDPNYPLALAGSQRRRLNCCRNIDSDHPARLQHSQRLAEQALAIDPQLAEVHVALGTLYDNLHLEGAGREHLDRGVAALRDGDRARDVAGVLEFDGVHERSALCAVLPGGIAGKDDGGVHRGRE